MSNLLFPVIGGGAYVSSGWGPRNVSVGSKYHRGIDIAASSGTPVIATTDMKIISSGWNSGGFGNLIIGQDAQGQQHYFGHLSGMNVSAGQMVSAGQHIGAVGTTGTSSGNHLHYGIKSAGKWIDPLKNGLAVGKEAMDMAKGAMKKAGDVAKDVAVDIAAGAANAVLPGSGEIVKSVLGDDDKSLLEQFKEWLKKSGFFQRLALAFFGFILLFGAVMLMKSNTIQNVLGKGK